MKLKLFFLGFIMITCSNMTSTKEDLLQSGNLSIESHEHLIKYKKDYKIEGLAFAIFNNRETLFSECIGKSTYGLQINEETQFSIQSISKNITSLAVMTAVQAGLLNLDTPILSYLPSFKVNSKRFIPVLLGNGNDVICCVRNYSPEPLTLEQLTAFL